MNVDLLFEVKTPLGFTVRCTRKYWDFIVSYKHPVMAGRERDVARTLADPDEVRRSRKDPAVLLFYQQAADRRWLCGVSRREGGIGFLITAYPTDAIKAGETVWTKSK